MAHFETLSLVIPVSHVDDAATIIREAEDRGFHGRYVSPLTRGEKGLVTLTQGQDTPAGRVMTDLQHLLEVAGDPR